MCLVQRRKLLFSFWCCLMVGMGRIWLNNQYFNFHDSQDFLKYLEKEKYFLMKFTEKHVTRLTPVQWWVKKKKESEVTLILLNAVYWLLEVSNKQSVSWGCSSCLLVGTVVPRLERMIIGSCRQQKVIHMGWWWRLSALSRSAVIL